MKKKRLTIGKYTLALTLLLNGFIPAHSQQSLTSTVDCSEIVINYINDPELTKSEKLAMMEKAFYDSLNKFEFCTISTDSSASDSSSNSASASGADGADGTSEAAEIESIANDTMQGTEAKSDLSEALEENAPPLLESTTTESNGGLSGGKIPEDIPPAANDDVIAAQIRIAAEAEKDPQIRKKLWNEYRKYKGINLEQ